VVRYFRFTACRLSRLIDLGQLQLPGEHRLLPPVMLGLHRVELGHHVLGEERKCFTDVLVAVASGLVQQDHLVDGSRIVAGEPIKPPLCAFWPAAEVFHPRYSSHRLVVPGTTGPCSL